MKHIILLLIANCLSAGLYAQQGRVMDRIKAARIALITERLELTPDQAEKFWPVYNEYTDKRQALRNEFKEVKENMEVDGLTDKESDQLLEHGLRLKEESLGLDRVYAKRLSQVISSRQLLKLKEAEDEFKQMLLERLRERRQRSGG